MILNKEKRVAVLLNPKTGSTSLQSIFKDWRVTSYGSHVDVKRARMIIAGMGEEVSLYTFYTFCRDPIERFLSAMPAACLSFIQLHPNRGQVQEFLNAVFPEEYIVAPPRAPDESDITNIEHLFLRNIGATALPSQLLKYELLTGGVFTQKHWLEGPNVEILKYEDYEESISTLCQAFEIDVPEYIPHDNVNDIKNKWQRSQLPDEEIAYIKEYYKDDYAFLESKGISYT